MCDESANDSRYFGLNTVKPPSDTWINKDPSIYQPASPFASNYLLNEQWAPLQVYDTRAPLRRKLRSQHKQIVTAKRLENPKCPTALARPWLEHAGFRRLLQVLGLSYNTDCCYQRLSLATIVISNGGHQQQLSSATVVISNGCHAAYLQLRTTSS